MGLLIAFMVWSIGWGGLGNYISRAKGRGGAEGIVFGVALGPLGLLLLVLMPTANKPEPVPVAYQFKPRKMYGVVAEDRLRKID